MDPRAPAHRGHRRMNRFLRTFSATVALSWSSSAAASPLFELTGDTMGTGGLQGRTRASGAAASYFNPALLPDAEQGLELSEFMIYDWIRTTYDARAPGVDVPVSAVERFGDAQPSL